MPFTRQRTTGGGSSPAGPLNLLVWLLVINMAEQLPLFAPPSDDRARPWTPVELALFAAEKELEVHAKAWDQAYRQQHARGLSVDQFEAWQVIRPLARLAEAAAAVRFSAGHQREVAGARSAARLAGLDTEYTE